MLKKKVINLKKLLVNKTIKFENFCFFLALYFTTVINTPFWLEILEISGGFRIYDLFNYFSLFLILFSFFYFCFYITLFKYSSKLLTIVLILISSLATFAVSNFKAHLGSILIRSIFETDTVELLAFISPHLILYTLTTIIIPCLLIGFSKIIYPSAPKFIYRKLKVSVAFIIIALTTYFTHTLFLNLLVDQSNNRHIKNLIIPINVIQGLRDYWIEHSKPSETRALVSQPAPYQPHTPPLELTPIKNSPGRKTLLVFVLGESARSSSFSLNGYSRETNPLLKSVENVVSYTQFSSCGTATAISIPCMFSSLGRLDFNHNRVRERENLLQIIRRNGIEVQWYDNGMGTYEVIKDGIQEISLGNFYEAKLDSILTEQIPSRNELIQNSHHRFIILHQRGSHGPDYWRRYPKEFAIFQPDCSSSALSTSCSQQEVINAYDNTILYTDYNLKTLINQLDQLSDLYDTGLIYVSDHGESTGEFGIYMHGIPYSIAPKNQTHIPFITWFSNSFIKNRGLNLNCLRKHKDAPSSHDHIFSSVLALLDLERSSPYYQSDLDLFRSCKHSLQATSKIFETK